jgi:hypothetical protein
MQGQLAELVLDTTAPEAPPLHMRLFRKMTASPGAAETRLRAWLFMPEEAVAHGNALEAAR